MKTLKEMEEEFETLKVNNLENNNCDYCDSYYSCYYYDSCNDAGNGSFCYNLKLEKKDKTKYWLLNKEITKEEFEKYKQELEE